MPECPWCGQVYLEAAGCTAPEASHTQPHDGHGWDARCRDCGALPGYQHHPRCCVAVCGGDDWTDQALMCGCQWCEPINAPMWEAFALEVMASHPVWGELG
jgi:hypothetical protein